MRCQVLQADTGAGSDNLSETTLSEHLKRSSSLPAVEPLALYPRTPAAGFQRVQPSSARADGAPPEIFKPRPRPASAADLLSLARDVGSFTSQDGEILQARTTLTAELLPLNATSPGALHSALCLSH